MLIQMDVFDKLPKPYFQTITHPGGTIGEDVTFCKKASDHNIQIYCDPTFKLGHIGKHIY
jgi:hypothetical protein